MIIILIKLTNTLTEFHVTILKCLKKNEHYYKRNKLIKNEMRTVNNIATP